MNAVWNNGSWTEQVAVNTSSNFTNSFDGGPPLYVFSVLVLQCLNTVLSTLSLIVFHRLKRHHNGWSTVLHQLILMSTSELMFGIGALSVLICTLTWPAPAEGSTQETFLRVCLVLVNSAVCVRNNWIASMTLIRCLMLSLPIRTKGLFTNKRVLFLFLLLCGVGIFTGVWNSIMCWQDTSMNSPHCILQYLVQAGIPVPMVIITSAVTLLVLKLSITTKFEGASTSSSMHCQGSKIMKGRRRAMRLFLTLAITYSILEFPSFIKFLLDMAKLPFIVKHGWILDQVNINLLALDSVLNFFMFVSRLQNFRKGIRNLFLCRRETENRSYVLGGQSKTFSDGNTINYGHTRRTSLAMQYQPRQHQYLRRLHPDHAEIETPFIVVSENGVSHADSQSVGVSIR